jgi:SAM-dependent methyltransferase
MTKDKQATINTYNTKALELADYFSGIGSRKQDIKKAFAILNRPNPNVIEIGCGNGRDAQEILLLTDNYLGTDVSKAMIELAKAKCSKADFVIADQETYTVPDNTDIIFAFASLLHSDKKQVRDFLLRSHKPLSANGVIYISLKFDNYHKELQNDKFGERVFYYYEPSDIKTMVKGKFKPVYEDIQQIGKTKWFTMALQKI